MRAITTGALLTLFLLACGREQAERSAPGSPAEASLSRDAKVDTVEMFRADLDAPRHPSDGGGRAWLAYPEASHRAGIPAGSRQRFEIVYEAGPLGVAKGGAVYLQTSPFWGWDAPQMEAPDGPGYTEVRTEASGIDLDPSTPGNQLLVIHIKGRNLEPGERIHIVYGAGPSGARVDSYAEHRSRLWIAVDGDGDGVRSLVPDSPWVDIQAGEPSRLVLTVSTTARPGERFRIAVALLDSLGNAGYPYVGEVVLEPLEGLELQRRISFKARHEGHRTIEGVAKAEGVYRLRATASSTGDAPGPWVAESNPLVVREDIPRVLWGDLHGHSQISDGTGTPEDYFRYARDVAALDVVALTDHDHWGMRFLDQAPEYWSEIQDAARRSYEPGRFVPLLGYEWTSWLHGHRHILYFGDDGQVLSSMDPRYETPNELWEALGRRDAITVAHHPAGGPISVNWRYVPDPDIEPVIEVVSVHGSSEAADSPRRIYDAVEENFVRDALDRGLTLGFVGGGDGHDGHPGLAHLVSPGGGLTAMFSEQLSREAVLESLRARRVYATNGPRIWLRLWLDDHPMGSVLPQAGSAAQSLRFVIASPAPIERADVIRTGKIVRSFPGSGRREWFEQLAIPSLASGEYLYIRIVQEDGGMAWSSPVFVR